MNSENLIEFSCASTKEIACKLKEERERGMEPKAIQIPNCKIFGLPLEFADEFKGGFAIRSDKCDPEVLEYRRKFREWSEKYMKQFPSDLYSNNLECILWDIWDEQNGKSVDSI